MPAQRFAGATWLGAISLAATIPFLMWLRPAAPLVAYGTSTWYGNLFNNVALPMAVALLFYGLIRERTWLAQLLASPAMQALGKSSYCFYLLHAGPIPEKLVAALPFLQNGWLFFGLLLLLSLGLHYGFEEPVNRWLRGWFHKPPSLAMQPVPAPLPTR
jgi:peptidoglycan/LPS O-acetylase OafA/YrhL